MTNQFLAGDTARTFAHKKGATAAAKKALIKHDEAHGDVLFSTGFEVEDGLEGDRFGVIVFVDLTPAEAPKIVGPELDGFVIDPTRKAEPKAKADPDFAGYTAKVVDEVKAKVVDPSDDGSDAALDPAPDDVQPRRRNADINIDPSGHALIAARHGSKQQIIIDLLARDEGATLGELVESCVRKDGTNWNAASLMAGLYHHIPHKGYGIVTSFDTDSVAHYHLVLPDGIEKVAEPRRPQSQTNLIKRIRDWCMEADVKASSDVQALSDDQILVTFRNLTAVKAHVASI